MRDMSETHWYYIYKFPRWSPESKLRRGPPWLFFTPQSEKLGGGQTLLPSRPSSLKPGARQWQYSQLWFWEPLNYPTNYNSLLIYKRRGNFSGVHQMRIAVFKEFISIQEFSSPSSAIENTLPCTSQSTRHGLYLSLLRQPSSRVPKCQFFEFNCYSTTLNPLANRHSSLYLPQVPLYPQVTFEALQP